MFEIAKGYYINPSVDIGLLDLTGGGINVCVNVYFRLGGKNLRMCSFTLCKLTGDKIKDSVNLGMTARELYDDILIGLKRDYKAEGENYIKENYDYKNSTDFINDKHYELHKIDLVKYGLENCC